MTPNGETPCTDCNGSGINGQTGQWCTCDVGLAVRPKAPPEPAQPEVRFSEKAIFKIECVLEAFSEFPLKKILNTISDILAADATTQLRAAEKAAYERGFEHGKNPASGFDVAALAEIILMVLISTSGRGFFQMVA